MLNTESGKPIPVLNHDHGRTGVGQNAVPLAALAVQARPDFLDDLTDRQTQRDRTLHHTDRLPVQVALPITTGHRQ